MDPTQMVAPSVSPLSHMSHADPVIADQSPPLSSMHRSASADMFSLPHEHHSNLSDDGLMLSEMYSKQNLNIPMPSPGIDDGSLGLPMQDMMGHHTPTEMDDFSMMQYTTIDPANLKAEHSQ